MQMQITVRGFLRWLKTRDPNETYCFTNNNDCICARYARHLFPHAKDISVIPHLIRVDGKQYVFPSEMNEAARYYDDQFTYKMAGTGMRRTVAGCLAALEKSVGITC